MLGTIRKLSTSDGEVQFLPLQHNARLGWTTVGLAVQMGRECLHWLLRLHGTVAVGIGHVVCCPEEVVGVDQAIAAVGNSIGTAGLVMEVAGLADIVAIPIGIFWLIVFVSIWIGFLIWWGFGLVWKSNV